ncbi:MAG: DUF4377 domain-containing protein [Bacteroidales bacterium]|nr:DUF4377 domain-containing protein [Bacteroidales bacterium]
MLPVFRKDKHIYLICKILIIRNARIKIPLNAIEDFNYEVGHEYRLKVLKTHLANPPADGSDIK